MQNKYISHSVEETKEIARQIAKQLTHNRVLALYGDLGSGKTTFVRFFVESLGIKARVQSPTFVLHRIYTDNDKSGDDVKDHNVKRGNVKLTINHFDLYRITTANALVDLGLAEVFAQANSISLIEWPIIAESVLPPDSIKIYFEYLDETTRKITVANF